MTRLQISHPIDYDLKKFRIPLTSLSEELVISDKIGMIFHWSDFHETCDLVKSQIEYNSELRDDYFRREYNLRFFQLIPVWIKMESKNIQTTLFDLYEKFIFGQFDHKPIVDPFYPFEISFISATGPFKTMAITECFNSSIFRDFIFVYLLQGKLPRRDFRIHLNSKVIMEHGKGFSQADLLSIVQLTSEGILFSLESEVFFRHISTSTEEVRVLINSDIFKDCLKKNLDELKSHLSNYTSNVLYSSFKKDATYGFLKDFELQSSFDFTQNKTIYLFMKYQDPRGVVNLTPIKDFVAHTKSLVHDYYQPGPSEVRRIA